jgi:anti-sigma B factor antagonist
VTTWTPGATAAAAVDPVWDEPSALPVLIDMAGVNFIDSAGLGALSMARPRARDVGRTFGICSPEPPVERLLHITRLYDILMNPS